MRDTSSAGTVLLGQFRPVRLQVINWGMLCSYKEAGNLAVDAARKILTAIRGRVVMLRGTGRVAYLQSSLASAMAPLAP
jgi:hypothetical protein